MDGFAKILTDKWKDIIESIIVDGYSRKVESVDLFRLNSLYNGYPQIEFCYKVNFNFEDEISASIYDNNTNPYIDSAKDKWHRELESIFTNLFYNKFSRPRPGTNSGETKFENDKVDYMTNQGYRFIVQFYPQGFVSELRNEKLEILGL